MKQKYIKIRVTGNKPMRFGDITIFPGEEQRVLECKVNKNHRRIKIISPITSRKKEVKNHGIMESKRSNNLYRG